MALLGRGTRGAVCLRGPHGNCLGLGFTGGSLTPPLPSPNMGGAGAVSAEVKSGQKVKVDLPGVAGSTRDGPERGSAPERYRTQEHWTPSLHCPTPSLPLSAHWRKL